MSADNYYDRATVTLCVDVRIEWRRGDEASRNDALDAAQRLVGRQSVGGTTVHGCYGASLVADSVRLAGVCS